MALGWIQATDRLVGKSGAYTDTLNRALRDLLSQSGYDPDAATFPGLMGKVFNVRAFGAVANWNGTTGTDDSVAFNAALAAAIVAGGRVVVPPGQYYLNSTWLGTLTAHAVTVLIEGHGAELFAGTAVTGAALKIVGGATPHGPTIRGLKFNHRNNTTVAAAIELRNTTHVTVDDITVEDHNTKAGYAGLLLGPSTPGDDNTACFWTRVTGFKMRPRSGGDGTFAQYGIKIEGTNNATHIGAGCSFVNCTNAIALVNDGVGTNLANGVTIDGVWFEGVTTAVSIVATPTTGTWAPGVRITNNRVESTTTFVSLTTGGAAAIAHSSPVWLSGNYCVNGSVTTWLNNPTGANVSALESVFFGVHAGNWLHMSDPFRLYFTNAGANLLLANESGLSNYLTGHLQMGEDAASSGHLFFNTANGDLRWKAGSAPSSATDGVMVAANGGLQTLVGLKLTQSSSKIVGGSTSLSLRDSTDANDNLKTDDSGNVTARASMTSPNYKVGANQVVGARVTGWNAPTGTQTRGTFDASATLATTAQTLVALIADLRSHGLINT